VSSHASRDVASRRRKAEKIGQLLQDAAGGALRGRLLEVGTGSGVIAHWFATREPPLQVEAVDVRDQRVQRDGFGFRTFDGATLPFADGSFDFVISNHVIEHVGDRAAQARHLAEIRRVMAPGALCYLACPSRWQFVEPHFRLPALSWLPRGLRDGYVRLGRRGSRYDCELVQVLAAGGLRYANRNAEALVRVLDSGGSNGLRDALARRVPVRLLARLYRWSPTMVYVLQRDAA
jgi:SAM-dependent methyltransferase